MINENGHVDNAVFHKPAGYSITNCFRSAANCNKKPTNWLGQAKRRATKIRDKAVGGSIFGSFFSNLDKCRPEEPGDVIAGSVWMSMCNCIIIIHIIHV